MTTEAQELDMSQVDTSEFDAGIEATPAPKKRGRPPKAQAASSAKVDSEIQADIERAEAAQQQQLEQLRKAMEQNSGPGGVSFGQVWGDERTTLVKTYVPDALPKRGPNGETTAMMKDPYYGQTMDTLFDEYGDGSRKHQQHLREGWVPVVDKDTGEHVRTRGGDALYKRPIELRKARDKAMRDMGINEIPDDILGNDAIQDGITHNETTIERKGG